MSLRPSSPPRLAAPRQTLAEHWRGLARASAIEPGERLLLALSGGADSVFLLHLLAAAVPRPELLAVHVDHGLRGAESAADARFCAELCARLEVPFERHTLALAPGPPSLEARARRARYACLARSARRSGHTTLLTGHHADDALETLLLRWMRGSSPAGLYGPRRDGPPPGALEEPGAPALRLVRPLYPLRREEVRVLARAHGIAWREDGSNADRSHARNRVRHDLLPALDRWCGEEGLDHLRTFAEAAERLETELARATADLTWSPLGVGPSTRDAAGGPRPSGPQRIGRPALMRLPRMLLRRVLWRLVTTGVGSAPGSSLLEALLEDLLAGRCARHTLPRGWELVLRSDELLLLAPPAERARQRPGVPPEGLVLQVPGAVRLGDGSRITATLVAGSCREDAPHEPPGSAAVELDAAHLPRALAVRLPGPGDRFHPLGAPGSKRLSRYLADRRLPREERSLQPLVLAGDEIVWVPGFAPAESRRVRSDTRQRVRLAIEPGSPPDAVRAARPAHAADPAGPVPARGAPPR